MDTLLIFLYAFTSSLFNIPSLVIASGMTLKTVVELLQMSRTISRIVCFSQQTLQSGKKQQLSENFSSFHRLSKKWSISMKPFTASLENSILDFTCDAVGRIVAWELSQLGKAKIFREFCNELRRNTLTGVF